MQHKNIPTALSSGLAVLLLIFLSLDSFRSPDITFRLIGIPSSSLILPVLILLLLVRLKTGNILLPKLVSFIQNLFFPIIGTTTVVLSLYDFVTPANAAYALTQLHQDRLGLLTIATGLLLLMKQPNQWWQKYWKQFLYLLPWGFLFTLAIIRTWPFDIFYELVKEDRQIEYAQFGILAFGAIWSGWQARKLFRLQKKFWAVIALGCCVVFGLVAGDEISWGQRILRIPTPEKLQELNRQEEITVHNLYAVEWLVYWGYLVASIIGLGGRVSGKFILPKKLRKYAELMPPFQFAGYFIVPFIFFLANLYVQLGTWHEWSEPAELYLYSGIVLWMSMVLSEMSNKKKTLL